MRLMRYGGIALAAAAALLLSGCSASGPSPTSSPAVARTVTASPAAPSVTTATPRPSGSASAPPRAAATGAPAPDVRSDPDAPKDQCANGALDVSVQLDPDSGGLGSHDYWVVFRDTGGTCTLRGVPGLSAVGGGDGRQIGVPASRVARSADVKDVRLQHGAYALAQLHAQVVTANGGIYAETGGEDPKCEAKHADGFRVYPPHAFRAVFARVGGLYACSTKVGWYSIGVVRPGSTVPSFHPRF